MHGPKGSSLLALAALLGSLALAAGPVPEKVGYIPFAEAKPILEAMAEALPAGLSGQSPEKLESLWPTWVKSRDAEIRERLTRGDEDTVVNFLLFGTSFTKQPRVTSVQLREFAGDSGGTAGEEAAAKFRQLVEKRLQDLANGMSAPGNNERLIFARKVVGRAGIEFVDEAGRKNAARYLYENYLRVLKEQSSFQQV